MDTFDGLHKLLKELGSRLNQEKAFVRRCKLALPPVPAVHHLDHVNTGGQPRLEDALAILSAASVEHLTSARE